MHFSPKQSLHLVSLGCTKNLVDSEVMLGRLKSYSLTPHLNQADVIIINTCGFIESAKQESIQNILYASQNRKKGALLVVSGCLAQRYAKELQEEISDIDIITGVSDYDKIDKMIAQLRSIRSQKVFLADENNERVIINSSFHAFIKLSEGCNQSCSFCAIPSFKGKLHSRTLHSTLKEIELLYSKGFRDFSFIAQDSSSYMRDLGIKDGLVSLIKAIDNLNLQITCRIFYLYPSTTTQALIESIATSRSFLPYFDMPIQHISDSMLRHMRRGADKNTHLRLLQSMRNVPDSFVRTTLVIGHPGEDEAEFAELHDFIESFKFDRVNIFAYSPQENTAAFALPHANSKITNKRINALNRIIKAQYKDRLKDLLNKEVDLIVDGKSELSQYFYKARLMSWGRDIDGEILINDSEILDENGNMSALREGYYRALITQYKQGFLFGRIISHQGNNT